MDTFSETFSEKRLVDIRSSFFNVLNKNFFIDSIIWCKFYFRRMFHSRYWLMYFLRYFKHLTKAFKILGDPSKNIYITFSKLKPSFWDLHSHDKPIKMIAKTADYEYWSFSVIAHIAGLSYLRKFTMKLRYYMTTILNLLSTLAGLRQYPESVNWVCPWQRLILQMYYQSTFITCAFLGIF